jgi:hypothetical protein
VREYDRNPPPCERFVKSSHQLPRANIIGADDDAVRFLEIGDCRAFAQEFRIGHNGKGRVGSTLANDGFNFLSGSKRNRGLRHHQGEPLHMRGNHLGRFIDKRKISIVCLGLWRCTNCYENDIGRRNAFFRLA